MKYRVVLEVSVTAAGENKKDAMRTLRELIGMIKGVGIVAMEGETRATKVTIKQVK